MSRKLNTAVFSLLLVFVVSGIAHATEWVKVTNKSRSTVRVKVWHGLNIKMEVLKPNKSFSWKRNNTKNYNVRVFRKEGKLVKTWKRKRTLKGVDYSSDIVVTSKLKISPTKPRHLVVKNTTGLAIVVRLYKGKDNVKLIPLKSFTIQSGKSVTYRSVVEKFNIKVFELKDGFNRHLVTRTDIPRKSTVSITNKDGWNAVVRR